MLRRVLYMCDYDRGDARMPAGWMTGVSEWLLATPKCSFAVGFIATMPTVHRAGFQFSRIIGVMDILYYKDFGIVSDQVL